MKKPQTYESPALVESIVLDGTLLTGSADGASFSFTDPFEDEITF